MSSQAQSAAFSLTSLRAAADKIAGVLDKIVLWVCAVFLLLMTIDILVGVFFRYVLQVSIIWSEELARYMMIWAVSLAMSSGIKRGEHLTIRFLVDTFPPGLAKSTDILIKILLFGFLLILLIYGIELTQSNSEFTSQALDMNMAFATAAVPVAAALMLIQLIISAFLRLTGDITRKEKD